MKKLMTFALMCGLSVFTIGCGPEDNATDEPITPAGDAAPAETPAEGGSAE